MVDSIKITALQDIGANIAYTTLVPLVNMAGTPTTQKANLQNLGNLILNGAGGSYFARAAQANIALSVANAAQPNITSLGNLTSLRVTGNITAGNINGGNIVVANFYYGDGRFLTNVVANSSYSNSNVANYLPTFTGNVGAGNVNVTGTVYTSGISSTGSASLTILNVSTTANLGAVGNITITGGTNGQKLTTNGNGVLSWTNDANSSYGNSNVVSLMAAFGSNTITTTGNVSVGNIIGNGQALTNIAGANVSGFVPNANVANTAFAVAGANVSGTVANANLSQYLDVSDVSNNFSYHVVLSAGSGDKSLHIDADDNLQYNPNSGLLTANRVDATFFVGNLFYADGYPVANVDGIGNIATINLTGSNANVLYGNGVFAPVSGGGGLPLANGNSNFNIATANGNATVTTAGAQTWTFDTTGNLTIPGTITSGNTITIDNRASGNGADINLYSADDILIQARDRDAGSTSEGGDINIYAGDSAIDSDTSAGDIVIEAGAGGASNVDFGGDGGFIRIEAGRGGAASTEANGFSALSGGSLTLNAGNAGTNNGNIFRGATGGDVTINAGDSTGNGEPGGSIILRSGDAGANALAGQIQLIISGGDVGPGGTWIFDGEGIIQLPNSGTIGNDGNNIDIGSSNAISLEASSAVNIYTDTGTAAWQWQFQDDGNLRLPTIELDVGNTINEQTVIQSQRKIIPGLRYSAEINGTTPTVVYTATSIDTTSMKVAMQIQHTGLGFEFFDVSATSTGGDTFYTVSNRVQPPTIDNSTVVVDLNGSNVMEITVTINSGAANSWVTYDATEFGIAVD
jgi:hypothetical protein